MYMHMEIVNKSRMCGTMGCRGVLRVPWGVVVSYGKYTYIFVPWGVNNYQFRCHGVFKLLKSI